MLHDGYVKSDFVTLALSEHAASKKVKFVRSQDLAHVPVEMRETCLDFLNYISEKSDKSILIRKTHSVTGESKVKQIPYMHRWCESYKNLTVAKLMYAADYFGEECECFLLTLTVPHRHMDYEECIMHIRDLKKKANRKLRDWGYTTRCAVLDPHANGYSHAHMLVKGSISSDRIQSLKLWLSGQFGYSKDVFKHGIHVKIPNVHLGAGISSDYHTGAVKNFASYMMKYIGKNLTSVFDDSKLLVFNASLWKTKSRLYGYSRDVSSYVKEKLEEYKALRYGKKETSSWLFGSSAICDNEGNVLYEIPRKRSRSRFEYKDVYVGTVSRRFYETVGSLFDICASSGRVLKFVGDWVEVYDRTVIII